MKTERVAASGGPRARPQRADRAFRLVWRYALLVFLVAVAIRGLYLLEAGRRPDFNLFYMDEQYNLEWAKSLATGAWHPPYDQLREGPYFRAPLYSWFLAGIFGLFGVKTLLARIIQIVLGSLSCALAYGVGAKCLGQRVGLVSGLVCALYWVLVYFDSQFLQPVLLVVLLLLALLLAFLGAERRDARLAGLAGLCFGLYSITRPEMLVLFPFAAWWAVKVARAWRPARLRWFALALALGFILPPALTTVRNKVVADDWVAVASQGGVNFYIGNNPESNGMQAVVPGTRATWWGGFEDTKAIAEGAAGHPLKASEVSRYWFGRGFAFIKDEPARWLGLTLKKAALFVGNVEIPNNEPYETRRGSYITLRFPVGFGLLMGLFVVALPGLLGGRSGVPRAGPEGIDGDPGASLRRGFISLVLQLLAVYSLTTVAFFVTGRFRAPLIPLVAIGAAAALVGLYDYLKARRYAAFVASVAAVVVIAGVLSVDYFGVRRATSGFAQYTDALDLLEAGNAEAAIPRLEAVRAARTVDVPELYTSLARAYITRGRADDGRLILEVAEDGLSRHPGEAELLWYASLGHVVFKEWALARDRVQQLLAVNPADLRALHLAFTTALAEGRIQDARSFLARAEAVDASSPIVAEMHNQLAGRAP